MSKLHLSKPADDKDAAKPETKGHRQTGSE